MNSRDKIRTMLERLLESELENEYRDRGFYGEHIEIIIKRERENNRFEKDAEELLAELEKDYFHDSINSVFKELKDDNKKIHELSVEKRRLLDEIRIKIDDEFVKFKNGYNTNQTREKLFRIEHLYIKQRKLISQLKEKERISEKKASVVSWLFVIFNFFALVIWLVLIYVLFDWNFIEPITWLTGITIVLLSNLTYAIFGKSITPRNLQEKRFNSIKAQYCSLYSFDEKEIELVTEEIELTQKILRENAAANKV